MANTNEQKAKLAADKAAKEAKEAEEAQKVADKEAKEAEEAKLAADKAAKEAKSASKLNASYEVCVTGFQHGGKMYRAGKKIDTKTYKKFIPEWLESGLIK